MVYVSSCSNLGILKPLFLVAAIITAIYLISDDTLNVYSALQLHEPSSRIFRSLLQVNLGLWCVAVSLAVYRRIVSINVVEELLFAHDQEDEMDNNEDYLNEDCSNDEEEEEGDENARAMSLIYWSRSFSRLMKRLRRAAYRSVEPRQNDTYDQESNDLELSEMDDADNVSQSVEDLHETQQDDDDENDGVMRADARLDAPGSNVPTPISVVKGALDNLLVILVSLFLFTITATGYMREQETRQQAEEQDQFEFEAAESVDEQSSAWKFISRIAAPTFPLVLFVYFGVIALFPFRKRRRFWFVVSRTLRAPIPSPVTFRDGFIGDVLTSSVRPLQDLAFTFCYLMYGLKGWWSTAYYYHIERRQGLNNGGQEYAFENVTNNHVEAYDNVPARSFSFIYQADTSIPEMEKSWIVHTIILPTCMISPLWWRFLQNLRQAYDHKERWPYLGNAFKYFLAAQVAMFGIYHPEQRNSALWLVSFVIATLYQVFWDIFMDWGLFERNKQRRWALRSERLYTTPIIYHAICSINVLLRFCWILTFLPPRYLDAAGRLTESFGDGLGAVFGPSLASAELVRRSLWGLLRFEWEAIKERSTSGEMISSGVSYDDEDHDHADEQEGLEMTTAKAVSTGMTPMGLKSDGKVNALMEITLKSPWWRSDMSSMNDVQILGELCMYATVFLLIGALAAAHRETF